MLQYIYHIIYAYYIIIIIIILYHYTSYVYIHICLIYGMLLYVYTSFYYVCHIQPCELCFLPDRPDLKSLTPCRNAGTAGLQQNVADIEIEIEM